MQIDTNKLIEKLAKKHSITLAQAKDIIKFQSKVMLDQFKEIDVLNDNIDYNFLINGFGTIYVHPHKAKWVKKRLINRENNAE